MPGSGQPVRAAPRGWGDHAAVTTASPGRRAVDGRRDGSVVVRGDRGASRPRRQRELDARHAEVLRQAVRFAARLREEHGASEVILFGSALYAERLRCALISTSPCAGFRHRAFSRPTGPPKTIRFPSTSWIWTAETSARTCASPSCGSRAALSHDGGGAGERPSGQRFEVGEGRIPVADERAWRAWGGLCMARLCPLPSGPPGIGCPGGGPPYRAPCQCPSLWRVVPISSGLGDMRRRRVGMPRTGASEEARGVVGVPSGAERDAPCHRDV